MAELDTPMTGLDPGGDVQFKLASCTVAEIRRYPRTANKCSFACTAPTALDSEGNYVSSSETLELAMSQETFAALTRRYQFSGCLDAWRYRATSGYASRRIEHDDAGEVKSVVFTISIRLSGSFASIISINHTFLTSTTTILALRVSPYDQRFLQQTIEAHQDLIGHALLVPTTLVEIGLASNMLFMQKIRHELSVVEKATGQHAWLQIPAADAPAHDSELSRLGHAAKIHVSLSYRRIESIGCILDLIKNSFKDLEESINQAFVRTKGPKHAYGQWVGDLEALLKFRSVDLKYNERRADNQITAIYGLLTQRDNMVGVSVAIESKKISEASKRDGSALKSLTVLTAVFFPATYIATLFTLPTFENTPFWLYWVVVVPLTLVIFGSWSCWTVYRQRQIAQETIRRDLDQDVELDPERAFPFCAGYIFSREHHENVEASITD
ncbi:hypothetical protein BJX63DRAFT_417536 [Aspergillus granulosus]|uniref:Uncharacterized protein n=1 Tax=Aspergillus granulosus TaxID=176169 RepID=A0ABR4I3V9_9EURO